MNILSRRKEMNRKLSSLSKEELKELRNVTEASMLLTGVAALPLFILGIVIFKAIS